MGEVEDLAWIGAFSIWLLGLRVTVTAALDSEDRIVYSNCPTVDAQVRIFYTKVNQKDSHQLESMATFQIPTGELVIRPDSDEFCTTGRVDWKQCLSLTFGSGFSKLLELKTITGNALGSLARIIEGLQRRPSPNSNTEFQQRGSFLYGKSFLRFLVKQFPELSILRPAMESAVSVPFAHAQCEFEAKVAMLRTNCNCPTCTPIPYQDPSIPFIPTAYCLLVLVETIVVLGHILSRTRAAERLLPTTAGLEYVYFQQLAKRLLALSKRSQFKRLRFGTGF